MRPLLILAALLIAAPVYAAENIVSDDGTVLKIENTEDAVAAENAAPTKLEGSSDSDLLDEPSEHSLGQGCSREQKRPTS